MTGAGHGASYGWGLVIAVTVGSVLASGFFSGTETGLISVSRIRLRHAGREGRDRRQRQLMDLMERLEEAILTCLLGTNLVNVLAGAIVTAALTARYGSRGELYATLVVSSLLVVFGEIVPKVLYREYPERLTTAAVPLLGPLMFLLAPARWLLRGYSGLWRRLLPSGAEESAARLDPRGLSSLLLANVPGGDQERRFRQSLTRFLELGGRDLSGLLRPLPGVVSVRRSATVAECLELALRSGLSRLAVREDDGSVAGWLAVRDLLPLAPETAAGPVPPALVRTSLLVDVRLSPYELLEELHGQGQKLAFVVDGAGRALGMVTLEDLMETVVGSIRDEFDRAAEPATG